MGCHKEGLCALAVSQISRRSAEIEITQSLLQLKCGALDTATSQLTPSQARDAQPLLPELQETVHPLTGSVLTRSKAVCNAVCPLVSGVTESKLACLPV